MHDRFRELCAAASLGEASAEELAILENHMASCSGCRQIYSDFMNIAAAQFALNDKGLEETLTEAQILDVGVRLRERVLSQIAGQKSPDTPGKGGMLGYTLSWWGARPNALAMLRRNAFAAGVAMVLAAMLYGSYDLGKRSQFPPANLPADVAQLFPGKEVEPESRRLTPEATILAAEVSQLRSELKKAKERAARFASDLNSTASEDGKTIAAQEFALDQLRRRLADAEKMVGQGREEISRMQATASDAQTTYVVDQVRIQELTDEIAQSAAALKRERELMQSGRDIRELMVARNLHIIDVYDTDSKGQTRPAFGRIFYTEGKSLIFYAYDLNEAKVMQANYHYRVWGGKEGQENSAKSLGIFYSDDKAQRRWVFKCEDAKVLNDIDSIFVTLETEAGSLHPKGQKFMDAYLRGLPNHP